MKPKEYSVKEAAELLGLTDKRIIGMLAQDKKPTRRKTHFPNAKKRATRPEWRIPEGDIEAYLAKKGETLLSRKEMKEGSWTCRK